MRNQLKAQWLTVPVWIRKPVILIVGAFFILAAALTGWIPGPGGIPLFLIGIAVLATEFAWAKRIKTFVLGVIYGARDWYRQHRTLGMVLLTLAIAIGAVFLYLMLKMVLHI